MSTPTARRRRRTPWTLEGARAYLDAARMATYWPIWYLLLASGLKRREVRCGDLHLERNTARIRQSVTAYAGRAVIGPLKTATRRRTVRLSPGLQRALRIHLAHVKELMGQRQADDLVFATIDNTPINPNSIHKVLGRLIDPKTSHYRIDDFGAGAYPSFIGVRGLVSRE